MFPRRSAPSAFASAKIARAVPIDSCTTEPAHVARASGQDHVVHVREAIQARPEREVHELVHGEVGFRVPHARRDP